MAHDVTASKNVIEAIASLEGEVLKGAARSFAEQARKVGILESIDSLSGEDLQDAARAIAAKAKEEGVALEGFAEAAFSNSTAKEVLLSFKHELCGGQEAAKMLGISRTRVNQLGVAGKIGVQIGGRWIFTKSELKSYAANHDIRAKG